MQKRRREKSLLPQGIKLSRRRARGRTKIVGIAGCNDRNIAYF